MNNEQLRLSISLIGAGNLGKSLARLFRDRDLLSIQQVFTTNPKSAESAVKFIGAGSPHFDLIELEQTDIILIAVPDDQIGVVCNTLLTLSIDLQNTVIFHCSGVLSSSAIKMLSNSGASIASVHPIKSFANLRASVASFDGTFCGVEGDPAALDILIPLFSKLGANCLTIDSENKALYHCAAVFANNYMVSLTECAQNLYELSGIDRDQSMQLLTPMLRDTCENLVNFGTRGALTGPIARGDKETIEKHLNALFAVDKEAFKIYKALGSVALRLKGDELKSSKKNAIHKLLS